MTNLTDVIGKLEEKCRNLERERDRAIEAANKHHAVEVIKINAAIEAIRELNEACEACGGRRYITYTDAAGDSERETCDACGGSGEKRE